MNDNRTFVNERGTIVHHERGTSRGELNDHASERHIETTIPTLKTSYDTVASAYDDYRKIMTFADNNPDEFKAWKKQHQKLFSRLKAIPDTVEKIKSSRSVDDLLAISEIEHWRTSKRYSVSKTIEKIRKEYFE
jgi:hypothetical protein